MIDRDEEWMTLAIALAEQAADVGEIPVGAVVVRGDEVVGRGHNRRALDNDPLAHAEVVAIRDAAKMTGSWRLDECTIYVTLEPCVMCAGVIAQSRIGRCVYGAADAKAGGVRSLYQLLEDPRTPFRVDVQTGVCEEHAAKLLREFFRPTIAD
jgi:tRNA(adenine34) deaminase